MKNLYKSYLFLFILLVSVSKPFAQMQFIENKGQWDTKVNYRGDISGGAFFLENKGFTVLLQNSTDLMKIDNYYHAEKKDSNITLLNAQVAVNVNPSLILHSHAYKVNFLGSNNNVTPTPEKIMPTYNNYFIGNDKNKWAGNCKIYQAVTYKNIYPNIDVRYYTEMNQLKYDFIVNPGGNPNAIAMRYDGADKLDIINKELIIGTSVGTVKELYPYTYQSFSGKKQSIECKYVVKDNVVSFNVKNYDASQTLIIDPTWIFSSFTGSTQENWGYTATPAPDGSVFVGGIAFGSGYPVSPGAFQTVFGGGVNDDEIQAPYDIAIFKFSANGSQRLYATYLGGSGNEQPHSMICDAQGNLIVAGRSSSPKNNSGNGNAYPLFPAGNTLGTLGGYDIVVTKFNANGSALLGSMMIGGANNDGINIRSKYVNPGGNDEIRRNYGDDARSEVILDASGNVWLASCSQSTDFPMVSPLQSTNGGGKFGQDGVIMKFNTNLSSVLFSSYFGGSNDDACFVISQSPLTGNMYIAGGTLSTDLPGNKTNVIGPTNSGATEGFITEISNSGSAIIKTTYIGTNAEDMVFGLKFDKLGFPYIMGTTTSSSWPIVNATFSNAGGKQFICKLQPDLSAYIYSTTFGPNTPSPNISPVAFLVDRCQNVYVSGWGGGINPGDGYSNSGTFNLPEVNPIAGIPPPDGKDFYFFVLEKNAQSQLFGSHFGEGYSGSLGDHVDGGTSRFDDNGVIYQAVCACKNPDNNNNPINVFPTTSGVWSNTNNGTDCNEAIIKIQMNFAGLGASVKPTINGIFDTVGCIPLTMKFTDTLAQGKMYIWDYGDPSSPKKDTTFAPTNFTNHTYTKVGNFLLTLISVDSSTCNISDTAYTHVRVGNNDVTPDFNINKLGGCSSITYQFSNTTTAPLPVYTNKTFTWDFGDGTSRINTGFGPQTHTFPGVGTYKIWLSVSDTTFCNSPDSVSKTIRIGPTVKAVFASAPIGCVPFTPIFKNNSQGGLNWLWDFGDGTTSTDFEPIHLYNTPGNYQVRLIAYDSSTCNLVDTSAYFTITVSQIPIADFTWTPNPAIQNAVTNFTNLSTGATGYLWNFGDGDSSTEVNPLHQYNKTDTFTVTLIAYNAANCADTVKHIVSAIVVPVVAVPNAFTPGRFGTNSVVKVVGFAVGKMSWKIYNRWGQLVFYSSSLSKGWDGTFKGELQSMDVYTYTLDIEFTDGQKIRKTGDITLLR